MNTRKQILDAFQFRHACKEFDASKKISEEDFNVIIESARLSPSSFGLEPWKFLIVQNMKLREKIRPFCWGAQKQLPTASHLIVILARKGKEMKYSSEYIKNTMSELQKSTPEVVEKRLERLQSFQQNDFDLTDERKLFDWARMQTYIVLGNTMTAAALLGIDSCPIEGFDIAKVQDMLVKEKVLDATHFHISCMAAFGYRLVDPKETKTRRSLNQVSEWIVD